ncbi:MAG: hypothetical protein K2Z81_27315 [Cyanobacteria bacterium]|nr:hypothetical protein [Cyanobacteriota bacterium]
MTVSKPSKNPEPMWPTLVALAAAGGLFAALPDNLALGPRWLVLAVVAGLLIPAEACHFIGRHNLCRILGYVVISIVTVTMIGSVMLLLHAIEQRSIHPITLLQSASTLWITNILVFAVWYWRLDAGGPHKRSLRETHTHEHGAFLFPQMTMPELPDQTPDLDNWAPVFVDYLFLAFNTSTALSPTDVPVLSRWAKSLMMIQASISLVIIVLLAARAVNIL